MELEKAVQKICSSKIIEGINTKDFASDLKKCVRKVGVNDPDDLSCIEDLADKNGGFDIDYCARIINYKCFKTLLTTKCGMPKEEVEKNDETHFDIWNNL